MWTMINIPTDHFCEEYVKSIIDHTKDSFNPICLIQVALDYAEFDSRAMDSYSYHKLKREVLRVLQRQWPNTPESDLENLVHSCLDHIGIIMSCVVPYLKTYVTPNIKRIRFHSGDHSYLKFLLNHENLTNETIHYSPPYRL